MCVGCVGGGLKKDGGRSRSLKSTPEPTPELTLAWAKRASSESFESDRS